MGEISKHGWVAMEAVTESLAVAASDIELIGLNWPDGPSGSDVIDLHVESARVWVDAVAQRLEIWSSRARRITEALERHHIRRLR